MSLSLPISMKSMQRLMAMLSSSRALVIRGRHAVGKSEGVYQGAALRRADFYKSEANCAAMIEALGGAVPYLNAKNFVSKWTYDMGLPVIERRLSQMTEGDIIGLPIMSHSNKSTQFKPVDWLVNSVDFPVVLFLDERNRALEGVKQAVFQLADSKAFYGNRLHDETFITVAENIGDMYTVNQSDPAEVSRGAVVELNPSQEEWLDYVQTKCDGAMVEFCRQNNKCIEHNGTFEPNKKYPDRRAWMQLDGELTSHKLYDNVEDPMFYVLTGAFLGVEVAGLFKKFCAERDRQVSAADILKDWNKSKIRLGKTSNEIYVELVAKLGDWLKKHELDEKQARELAAFMHDAPPEPRMSTWAVIQKSMKNLLKVHPLIEQLMVRTATGQETSNLTVPTAPSGAAGANAPAAPEPRKRGARR